MRSVIAWILLLGPRSGMVNLIARDWFGHAEPLLDIYSFLINTSYARDVKGITVEVGYAGRLSRKEM